MSTMSLDDLRETFEFLEDWEDKYRTIIELGRNLPPMDDSLKTDTTKVRGCQSQVWLVVRKEAGGTLALEGDSDALIVKGLVAVMLLIYKGKTPAEVLAVDAKAILGELGLASHLSPQRANGLFAMVERIRAEAQAVE